MQKTPYVTNYLSEHFEDDDYATVEGYESRDGYGAARRALERLSPGAVISLVRDAGLQDRGGLGLPTGEQWAKLPTRGRGDRYLVCNAAESEPGSFGDRLILERAPHLLLEGILIAGFAARARATFVYVRGEYREPAERLEQAALAARARGYLGDDVMGTGFTHEVVIVRGTGGHLCGEQSALLASLEGGRGQPRRAPLQLHERGAFGRPTALHNVETLCHVPRILAYGAEWFRGFGTARSPGTTLYSVSGHVARPGVYELPLGTALDEIVFEHAGGVPRGRKVKAVIPGGLSAPVLPAGLLDVPMADESLRDRGSRLGSRGVVVMDERTCMVRTAAVISSYFREESCGLCTACREGTAWLHKLIARIERGAGEEADLAIVDGVAGALEGPTICGFADAAAEPLRGLMRHFPGDFEAHLRDGKCPFPESFEL